MVPFETVMVVSYKLSIVTNVLSLPFGCNLPSKASDAQINRGGSLWAKMWEEEVERCKQNFNTIWERRGAVVCTKMAISSAV